MERRLPVSVQSFDLIDEYCTPRVPDIHFSDFPVSRFSSAHKQTQEWCIVSLWSWQSTCLSRLIAIHTRTPILFQLKLIHPARATVQLGPIHIRNKPKCLFNNLTLYRAIKGNIRHQCTSHASAAFSFHAVCAYETEWRKPTEQQPTKKNFNVPTNEFDFIAAVVLVALCTDQKLSNKTTN